MNFHHFFILCFLLIMGSIWAEDVPQSSQLPLVVITQIVDHDALTKEREGIIKALNDSGFEDGKTMRILYQNAQGNIATASQIADGFVSQKPAVAIGISTPSAQSLIRPMAKHNVPVVFTAVTDPLEARLVSSLDKGKENVTGVSDGMPLRPQLELIQKMAPFVKTIGVLYNPGEANSSKAVEKLAKLAPEMGFSLVYATTARTADTLMAATSLIGKADAIFIPLDNTAMASIDGIVALGRTNKIPIFTPDYDSAERGVLAVHAPSHKAMGYKAGQLVARILKGEKASDIPIEVNHQLDLVINTRSAKIMEISILPEMLAKAKCVP
jgi:putative ABC transport system substrate-binding protein